jgi:L-fuculose-phosphate aldolase
MKLITDSVVEAFVEAGRRLGQRNLIAGSAGNMTMRLPDGRGIVITTRGCDLSRLTPKDLVLVRLDGDVAEGDGAPSSELQMHRIVYEARPDLGAVVHTHSIYATVIAAIGERIPAFIDELTFSLGGEIETSVYAKPGSEELGRNAVAALGDKSAALLANHGAIGVGTTLDEALEACDLVERAAQMYVFARAIGTPRLLPPEAVERRRTAYLKKREKNR